MSGSLEMRGSLLGAFVSRFYGVIPGASRLLSMSVKREGGQMRSLTLREVLRKFHGVTAGNYSYGSLLIPGMADRGTTIGAYVSIGPGVRRFGAAHPLDDPCMHPYWYNPKLGFASPQDDVVRTDCSIGHGAWIGAGAVILPGCRRIGIGAVIGAGSVVTRDIEDFGIATGNPATVRRLRLDDSTRQDLLSSRHWEKDPAAAFEVLQKIRERRS